MIRQTPPGGIPHPAAFAKILLMEPEIILLDEPTKGLDACSKQELADILYDRIFRNSSNPLLKIYLEKR